MTEVSTKEHPAPLDGFERAKPDEPIFTLQGGDPFAIEAVKFYIEQRREAGIKLDEGRERDAELIRCTQAEAVLWAMQAYRAGRLEADEEVEQEPDADASEIIAAVDLHDYRVRAARRISNMDAEVVEIRSEIQRRGFSFDGFDLEGLLTDTSSQLRCINKALEPRRALHGDPQ